MPILEVIIDRDTFINNTANDSIFDKSTLFHYTMTKCDAFLSWEKAHEKGTCFSAEEMAMHQGHTTIHENGRDWHLQNNYALIKFHTLMD